MHGWRGILSALLVVPTLLPAAANAADPHGHWQWPLSPTPVVVAPFVSPPEQWGAGHRGVDLAGLIGQPVLAIGAGTISFAGVIAGRGVVVVDHGELRSTYQPVLAAVHNGDRVAPGEVIGTLEAVGSHCAPDACLHLGVRRGAAYLDPLSLLGPLEVRLKTPVDLAALSGDGVGAPEVAAGSLHPSPPGKSAATRGVAAQQTIRNRTDSGILWGDAAALAGGAAAGLALPTALRRRIGSLLR